MNHAFYLYRYDPDSDQALALQRRAAARSILNCVDVCPKNLLPAAAIGKIKEMMVRRSV
jgi:succinate dehydrogenase/fumarate reductase-like Fe-S protein